MYLDFAYVGLGEVAFAKKDYHAALELFSVAADKMAGSRVKDATIGKAKTLLEMAQYDDARKLFEQIASVREWRGESTAYAVYSLGDIQATAGTLGGGDCLLPARIRALPEISAMGSQGLYRQRRELREAG